MLYETTPFYTCKYTGNHNKEASPDLGKFKKASSKETKSQKHTPKKKRKYPKNRSGTDRFKTAEFFANGNNWFQLSYLKIAQIQGVQELAAKERIKSDIKNGYITKELTIYIPGTKIPGRNKYHLTKKGRKKLGRDDDSNIPQSSNNSSKEEYIAKSTASPENPSLKINEEKTLLKKHGFEKLIGQAPKGWFKDLSLIKKCLKLANQKQVRGFKIKNPMGFITFLLQQEGDGYRKKITKEVSKKIVNNLPPKTPYEKDALLALKSLQAKGLDLSPTSLQPLLRKGLPHLKIAITVLEKYIDWNKPIKSLNGMLSWIVGKKDPMELLKPLAHSTEKQISKLKTFFTHNASHFTFSSPTSESAANKPHIELLIHSKSLNASMVKLYKKMQGEWKCLILEVGKTAGNFYELVLETLKKHFGGQYVFGN